MKNNLALNKSKTKEVIFCDSRRRKNITSPHPLPDVTWENSLKILGVTFTCSLSASDHIRGVISDCAQTHYALRVPVLCSHGLNTAGHQTIYTRPSVWSVWSAHFTDPESSVCTECHCVAHIRFSAFQAHLSCAHHPSLTAYPWAHLLKIGSFDISSHSWHWIELLPVLLHSCHSRHDDDCIRPALIACTYRSLVDPQSAVAHSQLTAPRYGTTCRLTSQLRRHSLSSDNALRYSCSRDHILTLSLNL